MSRIAAIVIAASALLACGPDATTPPNDPSSSSSSASSSSSTSSSGGSTGDAGSTAGNVKTLFVREMKAECTGGEGPRKCLQVRENESAEWTFFYSTIEGFSYEEGNKYELKVSVESVANPPQDSSSLKYKLVEIVSKQKVAK